MPQRLVHEHGDAYSEVAPPPVRQNPSRPPSVVSGKKRGTETNAVFKLTGSAEEFSVDARNEPTVGHPSAEPITLAMHGAKETQPRYVLNLGPQANVPD